KVSRDWIHLDQTLVQRYVRVDIVQNQIVILNHANGDSPSAGHLGEHAGPGFGLSVCFRNKAPEVARAFGRLRRSSGEILLKLSHIYFVRIKGKLDLRRCKVLQRNCASSIGLAKTYGDILQRG